MTVPCSPACACSTSPHFLAGPLSAQMLADLGADVMKVEPLDGEAIRAAVHAVAACQRGKVRTPRPSAAPALDYLPDEPRRVTDRHNTNRNAVRYAQGVIQLVTKVDDELVHGIDQLVESGEYSSRPDVVRAGVRRLIDETRREAVADAILGGYTEIPETAEEIEQARRATISMIAEEPW